MAVRLEREQRKRRAPFKRVVNDVLRAGLDALAERKPTAGAFRTAGFDLGPSLVGSLDNVEEVLSGLRSYRWENAPSGRMLL